MERFVLFLNDNRIQWDFAGRQLIEPLRYPVPKEYLFDLFEVPETTDTLEVDFEMEMVRYTAGEIEETKHIPGLSDEEGGILSLLGYEAVDISNLIGLTKAMLSGDISEELFGVLTDVEGLTDIPNPFIKRFLFALRQGVPNSYSPIVFPVRTT